MAEQEGGSAFFGCASLFDFSWAVSEGEPNCVSYFYTALRTGHSASGPIADIACGSPANFLGVFELDG
jgi:hypothetical protein